MAVVHATAQNYDSILKENRIVLVDFWAPWCGPCKMVGPIIEQLAEEYDGKVKVVKVDIDQEPDLAVRYGVQSIPTVIMFENGNKAASEVGARSLDHYKKMVEGAFEKV